MPDQSGRQSRFRIAVLRRSKDGKHDGISLSVIERQLVKLKTQVTEEGMSDEVLINPILLKIYGEVNAVSAHRLQPAGCNQLAMAVYTARLTDMLLLISRLCGRA